MAPPEFGACRGSAWERVPRVRTLLSFGSRSLHARWPCPVGWEGRREESRPLPWAWGGGTLLAPLLLGLSHPASPLTPRLGSGASCGAQALSGPSSSLGRGSPSPSALPLGGEIPGRGLSFRSDSSAEVKLPRWRRTDMEPYTLCSMHATHCACPRGGEGGPCSPKANPPFPEQEGV